MNKYIEIGIGIVIIVCITLFIVYILLIIVMYYKNKNNPIPQPIPTPLDIIKTFINNIKNNIVKPINAPNLGQINNLYYTNINKQCVPALQSNAVGWFIKNISDYTIKITSPNYNFYIDNQCNTLYGNLTYLSSAYPKSNSAWFDVGSIYMGYITLYTDIQFNILVNENQITPNINPSDLDIQPGDIIKIFATNHIIKIRNRDKTLTYNISS